MATILPFRAHRAPVTQACSEQTTQITQELLKDIESNEQMRALIDARLLHLTAKASELMERGAGCEPGELYFHKHLGVQRAKSKKEA